MSSGNKCEHQEAFETYIKDHYDSKPSDIYSDDFNWLMKVMKKDAFKAGVEHGRKIEQDKELPPLPSLKGLKTPSYDDMTSSKTDEFSRAIKRMETNGKLDNMET